MPAPTNTRTTMPRDSGGAMKTTYFALALGALAIAGCSLPNDPNLNGPSVTDYSTISNLAQLQTLVTGVLRGDRIVGEQEIYFGEIVGRDAYILTGSEFRYETELLGPPPGIDPGGFIGARGRMGRSGSRASGTTARPRRLPRC